MKNSDLLTLFVVITILHFTNGQSEQEIDYYVNLVNQGIADAYTYPLPTSAEEYRESNPSSRPKGNLKHLK